MPTPYHRLARESPAHTWWRLPVVGLLAVALYVGLTLVLVAVAFFAFVAGRGPSRVTEWLDAAGELDLERPDFFLLDMLSLAILVPTVLVAAYVVGARPVGRLSSVAGHLRWRWLARSAVAATVVVGTTIVVSVAVAGATDPSEVRAPHDVGWRTALALVLVLLVTPLQAAGEEYVFRGYVLQLVGSWTRFAVVPVVVSVPLFVAGHTYELWGLVDVGLFGLTAAVLTIRTGGLETAIAAHAVNNVVLFVLDALGVLVATDDSGAGPVDVLPTVVSGVMLVAWAEWSVRRVGLRTTA